MRPVQETLAGWGWGGGSEECRREGGDREEWHGEEREKGVS